MENIAKNESSIISFNAYEIVKEKNLVAYTLLRVLFEAPNNEAKEVKFTLTNKNLYIDIISRDMYKHEFTLFNEKIDRNDIVYFEVRVEDDKEIITICNSKDKEEMYVRDNSDSKNLALKLKEILDEEKINNGELL